MVLYGVIRGEVCLDILCVRSELGLAHKQQQFVVVLNVKRAVNQSASQASVCVKWCGRLQQTTGADISFVVCAHWAQL